MTTNQRRTSRVFGGVRKLSKSGQVSVPPDVRQALGAKAGDRLSFSQNKDGEFIVRRILSADEIAGKFGQPVDPEDLKDALREAREGGVVRQRFKDGSVFDEPIGPES